jgi:uracil permease
VPVFLASSFAFIAPIIYGVQTWGIPSTMCGLFAAGILYVIISFLVRIFGVDVLKRILPPVVTGPVIMVIGLILAPVAVHMALGRTGDGSAWLVPETTAMIVAGGALLTTIFASLLG